MILLVQWIYQIIIKTITGTILVIDFDDWKMAQLYSRGECVYRVDLIIKQISYDERGQY